MKLSLDGVSESRSTLISLDVYSAKLQDCNTVYPMRIIRPLCKNSVNYHEQLHKVLSEIDQNQYKLTHVVADNPKRAFLRNSLCHGAKYACEYCFANGTRLTETTQIQIELKLIEKKTAKIQADKDISEKTRTRNLADLKSQQMKLTKSTQIVWPSTSSNGEQRSEAAIRGILEEIRETGQEIKGIVGPSPLMDFQDFNFVYGISTEYLHSVCIGLVKRLLELCFNVGELRTRITNRKLSNCETYNAKMSFIKVPREFSRRGKKMDFSVLKAQELRNIILFFSLLL